MFTLMEHFLAMAAQGVWHMQPTLVFNEGWLLRFIMDFAAENRTHWKGFPILPDAHWFSEGLLPSPFFAVPGGDALAETYTHADGVIGSFKIGSNGKGDVELIDPHKQLLVMEAKLGSKFSAGTKNAPGYNQAARNVACMAEMIHISKKPVSQYKCLAFYVAAPDIVLKEEKSFSKFMDRQDIRSSVEKRVEAYKGRTDYDKKRDWFEHSFLPLLSAIELRLCSWEDLIVEVKEKDEASGHRLGTYYSLCLKHNSIYG